MDAPISVDRFRFLLFSIKEKLWIKPLTLCLLSIAAVFTAKLADGTSLAKHLPTIEQASVETLLSIMASSMLVIATFSAGTMVSAYASASRSSTPRSVSLIISDDASQNALSTFVGAFIFSVVAITASKNGFFHDAGIFLLFCLTCLVFAIVIITFVRWVDSVARLGRVGSTVQKVEAATLRAIEHRLSMPQLGGLTQTIALKEQGALSSKCHALTTNTIGYVQLIDMAKIQNWAKERDTKIHLALLPGEFCTPNRPLCFIEKMTISEKNNDDNDLSPLQSAFQIGSERSFEADPRYGLVVLSEIACRALSPSVNDPGTAISILGAYARLFNRWAQKDTRKEQNNVKYDRVSTPELDTAEMFDDAFVAIARDGASMIEVGIRVQKTLATLAQVDDNEVKKSAESHAISAYERSMDTLKYRGDIDTLSALMKNLNACKPSTCNGS